MLLVALAVRGIDSLYLCPHCHDVVFAESWRLCSRLPCERQEILGLVDARLV